MELASIVIASIAMIISALALFFSRKQYLRTSDLKYREELINALSTFERFSILLDEMRRERKKTGNKIKDHEVVMFEKFDQMREKNEKIADAIKEIVSRKKVPLDPVLLSEAKILSTTTESMSHWVELKFDRFKRFNESKVSNLKTEVEKLMKQAKIIENTLNQRQGSINQMRDGEHSKSNV